MNKAENAFIESDAQNRAWRSFLQGMGIDVLVAIAITVTSVFATAGGWGQLQWTIISFSFAKSILQAAALYVMRRFLDQSKVPTPTPPLDPEPEG